MAEATEAHISNLAVPQVQVLKVRQCNDVFNTVISDAFTAVQVKMLEHGESYDAAETCISNFAETYVQASQVGEGRDAAQAFVGDAFTAT